MENDRTSVNWLTANAVSEPTMIHIDWLNTLAKAALVTGEKSVAWICMAMNSTMNT